MGTLEIKLSDRKYNLGTRYFDYLDMMSMFLLICVACSIATSNSHSPLGSDTSEDSMVASLKTAQNVDNSEVDLDGESNVLYLEQSLLPRSRSGWCCCYRNEHNYCMKNEKSLLPRSRSG